MTTKFYIFLTFSLFAIQAQSQLPYFKNIPLPESHYNSSVRIIEQTANGYLWLGTEEGLFRFDGSDYQHFTRIDNVISLYEDDNGGIWVGTFGDGVYFIHPKTEKTQHFDEKILPNGNIISMSGNGNTIYLATLGGLATLDLRDIENSQIQNKIKPNLPLSGSNYIYKIYIDKKERVWLATDGNGISVLENGNITDYQYVLLKKENNQTDFISLKSVYSITEDKEGTIWFSTAETGIFYFKNEQLGKLNPNEAMPTLLVTGLTTNKKGEIIIVHSKGIETLNPKTKHLLRFGGRIGNKNQ